jgi:hypothetical protein
VTPKNSGFAVVTANRVQIPSGSATSIQAASDLGGREPARPQDGHVAAGDQAAQVARAGLVVARGQHQPGPAAGDSAQQISGERDGVRVRPMQVVQQQQSAGRRQHSQQAFAEHDRGVGERFGDAGHRPVRPQPPQRRQVGPEARRRRRRGKVPDRLRNGPVHAAAVDRAAAEHQQARRRGQPIRLGEEPRRADARLAQDHRGAAPAGDHAGHDAAQDGDLGPAAHDLPDRPAPARHNGPAPARECPDVSALRPDTPEAPVADRTALDPAADRCPASPLPAAGLTALDPAADRCPASPLPAAGPSRQDTRPEDEGAKAQGSGTRSRPSPMDAGDRRWTARWTALCGLTESVDRSGRRLTTERSPV